VGWPLGTLCGLQRPRGGSTWLLLLLLPMAVPPYIWALAVQALRAFVPYAHQPWFDGFRGVLWALVPLTLPLPLLAAWVGARCLPASQIESLWLAGGRRAVLTAGLRTTCGAAGAAALLAGAAVISDAGCDQIMGCHGFSSEVLIAFSARSDFAQASAKALAGMMILGPVAFLGAWLSRRQGDWADLGRAGTRLSPGVRLVPVGWLMAGLGILSLILLVVPLVGLALPLMRDEGTGLALGRAARLWIDRAWPSLQRPLSAVAVALPGGLALAIAARCYRGAHPLLAPAVLLLALPPAFSALGWVRLVGWFPQLLAPAQAGGWLVGIDAGLRTIPVAAVVLGLGLRRLSVSAWEAAHLAGMPAWRWWCTVVLPQLGAAAAAAAAVAGVLTAADVPAELMLQPPGGGSFASHLYAVMDNSSAVTVAALAVVHLATIWILPAGVILALRIASWKRTNHP